MTKFKFGEIVWFYAGFDGDAPVLVKISKVIFSWDNPTYRGFTLYELKTGKPGLSMIMKEEELAKDCEVLRLLYGN